MKNKKIDYSKYSFDFDKNEKDFFNLVQLKLNNPEVSEETYNEVLNSKKYKSEFAKKLGFSEDEKLNLTDTFRALVFQNLGTSIQNIESKSDSDKMISIKNLFRNSKTQDKVLEYLSMLVDISPILDESNWLMQRYVNMETTTGYNESIPINITTGSYYEWQQFSGGHWHNDRQKIGEEQIVELKGEWIYAHGYYTFSEVLAGKADLGELKRKIDIGLAQYYEEAIGGAFAESGSDLSDDYKLSGSDQEALMKLVKKVEQVTKQRAIIAGDEFALQHMGYQANINYISDKMSDQLNEVGIPAKLFGRDVLPIKLPSDSDKFGTLFVMPVNGEKFIHIVENGKALVREYNTIEGVNARQDMSIGLEIQKKAAVFVVKNFIHGEFEIQDYEA